ncbi:MAG TPA: hypothetical protein VGE14_13485 [Marmoricola sp.]
MKGTSVVGSRGGPAAAGARARSLVLLALVVLVSGAVLFAGAWLIGGEDAVSDNWVGVTVVVALYVGLFGSFAAMVMAVFAGLRHDRWSRLWIPLVTFPAVVAIVALLEALVFE